MSKSIERIVLAVFLALLAMGAAGLAANFPALKDIVGFNSIVPKGHPPRKFDAGELAANLAPLKSPTLWSANDHALFNSDQYLFYPTLYPDKDYLKHLAFGNSGDPKSSPRSPEGVPLKWYKDHGIDYLDPEVDRKDPDKDGFSNIEEYKNQGISERFTAQQCDGSKATDPNDPNSHPPYLAQLRLDKYDSRPFKLTFRSYSLLNGVYWFQIYVDGVPSEQQPPLKKKGDPLGFEGYIIGDFHPNIVKKINPNTQSEEQVDESTLELLKPDIDFKIALPMRQVIDAPESTANFVVLMPSEVDKVIKVPIGKILNVPYVNGQDFIVLSVDDNGAKIRDTKTKQEYQILKLNPGEWDDVPRQ